MARLKTPISYYGGKQMLLKHILPLIPEHTLYTEAFCGGCAVLFAKPPVPCEVINDTNTELVNFYRVAQTQYAALKADDRCDASQPRDTRARMAYQRASVVLHARRAGLGGVGLHEVGLRFDDRRNVRLRPQRHDDAETPQCERSLHRGVVQPPRPRYGRVRRRHQCHPPLRLSRSVPLRRSSLCRQRLRTLQRYV